MKLAWILAPLITIGTTSPLIFDGFHNPGNTIPADRPPQFIAQAKCAPAELSRSTPPFRCVTSAAFRCLRRNNSGGGGSLEYRGDTKGEILVKSNVAGTVAWLGFSFNPSTETLNLNVKKKNLAVQEQQIWDGFKSTLSKCR